MRILPLLTLLTLQLFALQLPPAITADFEQKVTNEHNQTLTYKGKMSFIAPDKTRWDYTFPSPKSVCSSKNSIVIIENDLEQATVYKSGDHIDIKRVFQNAVKTGRQRYETEFAGNTYTFTLQQGKIKTLSFTDALHNRSEITFFQTRYDAPPAPVRCLIPDGFDVIIE